MLKGMTIPQIAKMRVQQKAIDRRVAEIDRRWRELNAAEVGGGYLAPVRWAAPLGATVTIIQDDD